VGCDISRMVKDMNTNEAEVIDEFEEILSFLREVCSRYHLENSNGQFDQRAFINWVVVEAGICTSNMPYNLKVRSASEPIECARIALDVNA
jgi:hypothetical protein